MRIGLFIISMMLFSPLEISHAQATNCSDPQTTWEIKICGQAAYKAADGDLNADYKMAREYMRALDKDLPAELKGAEKALLKAQRIWIKYRDAVCASEGFNFRGGTLEGVVVISCLERMTRSRSERLRVMFEQN
jgi:uncharacterized protein YecT (DUF1311 family)